MLNENSGTLIKMINLKTATTKYYTNSGPSKLHVWLNKEHIHE